MEKKENANDTENEFGNCVRCKIEWHAQVKFSQTNEHILAKTWNVKMKMEKVLKIFEKINGLFIMRFHSINYY